MNLSEIEHKIACNEMSAAQVFTQMKQHIKLNPDMFWDVDNSEDNVNDPRDAFEHGFSQSTKIGETITFETAVRGDNITYKLTEFNDDGSFEIEPITQK